VTAGTLAAMGVVRRVVVPAVAMALALSVAAGCVPSEQRGLREVDDGSDSAAPVGDAPTFPDIGNVEAELVVDGLTYDFTTRPADQAYWSPRRAEAECAARAVVGSIGHDRLVSLGYRPGVAGASLNDLELEPDERDEVVDAFEECVDLVDGFAAILYGAGRMPTAVATCMARGMGESGMIRPLVEAWASGGAVDPFADNSRFASALVRHAQVCIPDNAFDWPHLRLPANDPLIDSDLPAGSERSAYADDRAGNTVTTTTAPDSQP
jgi:hypothetical protein